MQVRTARDAIAESSWKQQSDLDYNTLQVTDIGIPECLVMTFIIGNTATCFF